MPARDLLDIYSQAQLVAKRAAQPRLVEAILPEEVVNSLPAVVAETAGMIEPASGFYRAVWSDGFRRLVALSY